MNSRTWILNFDSAPFCNGSLHLGHVRNHVLGDIRTRWLRYTGVDVEYRTQFDAFGVPHEVAAEAAALPTNVYVDEQIRRMESQLARLNLSFSKHNHLRTCEPSYYRWTQWLFLLLWKAGRIYTANKLVRYCASCESFLANTQCLGDACWRCGERPTLRKSRQFFIRTSDYLDQLHTGIDDLTGWSHRARKLLRSFMGRQAATLSTLRVPLGSAEYTIRAFGPSILQNEDLALFVRPDHPLVGVFRRRVAPRGPRRRVDANAKRENAICILDVGGKLISVFAGTDEELPDDTDAVLAANKGRRRSRRSSRQLEAYLQSTAPAVRYRVGDWMISRNRKWGSPIPVVDCPCCGLQPVGEDQLPVHLAAHGGNGNAKCSACGSLQPCVDGTLDCFFDDAWSFWSASRAWTDYNENPFDHWRKNPPTEVHFQAGYDSFVYLHLYRLLGRLLFDEGITDRAEPIDFYHGHDVITAQGRKMSKRHGNTPDFDRLLDESGSDVVRLAIVGRCNPGKPIEWGTDLIRFAEHAVASAHKVAELASDEDPSATEGRLPRVDEFISGYRIASAVDRLNTLTTRLLKSTEPNLRIARVLTAYWSMVVPGIHGMAETNGAVSGGVVATSDSTTHR